MPLVCSCDRLNPSTPTPDLTCCAFDTSYTQVLRCLNEVDSDASGELCAYHAGQQRMHHRCPDCGLFVGFGRFIECTCPGKQRVARTHLGCFKRKFPGEAQPVCLHCGQTRSARMNSPREDNDQNLYNLAGRKGRTKALDTQVIVPYSPPARQRSPARRSGGEAALICPCSGLGDDEAETPREEDTRKKEKPRKSEQRRKIRNVVRNYLREMVAALPDVVVCRDLSHGKDQRPLPVVVDRNVDSPPPLPNDFLYATHSLWFDLEHLPRLRNVPGCSCVDGCDTGRCHCTRRDRVRLDVRGRLTAEKDEPPKHHLSMCRANCICRAFCETRAEAAPAALEVFWTRRVGWGVRTRSRIEKGACIGEYVGEDMDVSSLKTINKTDPELWKEYLKYAFFLNRTKRKVATRRGNFSRFINSSCSPNLTYCVRDEFEETDKILNQGVVLLFALREIQEGEELTINYQRSFFDDLGLECRCGADTCYTRRSV